MAWQTPKTNWGQAGQTVPVTDDFNRIEENIRVLEAADSLPTTTGTAPNYLVTIPDFIGLKVGRQITIKFHAATSGQAATLNVNSLGAKPIIKPGGGNPNIKAGAYNLVYDGANFQLLGEGGEYGTAGPEHVLAPYTIGTEEGLKQGTMPNRAGDTPALAISRSGTTLKLRAPKGFYDGTDDNVTYNEPNWIAANIPVGISMFGLAGSNTNKKWAYGTATGYTISGGFSRYLGVTGLSFKPTMIIIWPVIDDGRSYICARPSDPSDIENSTLTLRLTRYRNDTFTFDFLTFTLTDVDSIDSYIGSTTYSGVHRANNGFMYQFSITL